VIDLIDGMEHKFLCVLELHLVLCVLEERQMRRVKRLEVDERTEER
jgi:hypothetical protein